MKKILLLAFAALTMTVGAKAEPRGGNNAFFSTEKSNKGVQFGLRAGFNLASFHDWYKNENGQFYSSSIPAFNVGINLDIPILRSFYYTNICHISMSPITQIQV